MAVSLETWVWACSPSWTGDFPSGSQYSYLWNDGVEASGLLAAVLKSMMLTSMLNWAVSTQRGLPDSACSSSSPGFPGLALPCAIWPWTRNQPSLGLQIGLEEPLGALSIQTWSYCSPRFWGAHQGLGFVPLALASWKALPWHDIRVGSPWSSGPKWPLFPYFTEFLGWMGSIL